MKIANAGDFFLGKLEDTLLSQEEKAKLTAMASEETEEELRDILEQAQKIADPTVLFGICSVQKAADAVCINGVSICSELVARLLQEQSPCFPFIATAGTALEDWSLQYKDDFLTEFWADEIKKIYLQRIAGVFFQYLKTQYNITGHLTTLNPGSLDQWPLSRQRELFDILGGTAFVQAQTGVRYTESYLMLPSKSISGIGFESNDFYENCQYCGRMDCPNRRATPKAEEDALCTH